MAKTQESVADRRGESPHRRAERAPRSRSSASRRSCEGGLRGARLWRPSPKWQSLRHPPWRRPLPPRRPRRPPWRPPRPRPTMRRPRPSRERPRPARSPPRSRHDSRCVTPPTPTALDLESPRPDPPAAPRRSHELRLLAQPRAFPNAARPQPMKRRSVVDKSPDRHHRPYALALVVVVVRCGLLPPGRPLQRAPTARPASLRPTTRPELGPSKPPRAVERPASPQQRAPRTRPTPQNQRRRPLHPRRRARTATRRAVKRPPSPPPSRYRCPPRTLDQRPQHVLPGRRQSHLRRQPRSQRQPQDQLPLQQPRRRQSTTERAPRGDSSIGSARRRWIVNLVPDCDRPSRWW